MLMMIALAVPLIVVAIVCWLIAGRIDLKRKIKGWSGERSTLAEAEGARRQILMLRLAAGLCVVVAVVGVLVLNLMASYMAYAKH